MWPFDKKKKEREQHLNSRVRERAKIGDTERSELEEKRPLSKYTLIFETTDNKKHTVTWQSWPLQYMSLSQCPMSDVGLRYINGDGAFTCIPWHQVKKAEFIEKILVPVED